MLCTVPRFKFLKVGGGKVLPYRGTLVTQRTTGHDMRNPHLSARRVRKQTERGGGRLYLSVPVFVGGASKQQQKRNQKKGGGPLVTEL